MINRILGKLSKANASTKIILGILLFICVSLFIDVNNSPNTQILDTPFLQTSIGTINLKNSINIASSTFLKTNSTDTPTEDIDLSWNKINYNKLPSEIKYSLGNIYDENIDTIYIATVKNPLEENLISVDHILIIREDSVLIAAFTCVTDSLGKGHTVIVSLREATLLAQQKINRISI